MRTFLLALVPAVLGVAVGESIIAALGANGARPDMGPRLHTILVWLNQPDASGSRTVMAAYADQKEALRLAKIGSCSGAIVGSPDGGDVVEIVTCQ